MSPTTGPSAGEHQAAGPPALGPTERAPAPDPGRGLRPWHALALACVVLVVAVAAFGVLRDRGSTTTGGAVSQEVLEQRYGARVDLVAVTALGGMIELRFRVTDPAKAHVLFHGTDAMPNLQVEPSGQLLRAPSGMRHSVNLVKGGAYFIMYANPGNVVQAGTKVSVVIGDLHVAPVTARS